MARPQKEWLDYFPHDTDAVDDPKIDALRAMYGNDGYAFYFITCEKIYRNPNAEFSIKNKAITLSLVKKIGVTESLFFEILNVAFELNLFDASEYEANQIITSNGIKKRYEQVQTLRNSWRDKKNKKKVFLGENPIGNEGENATNKIKEKEIKEKEIKENNNNTTTEERIPESYYLKHINPNASNTVLESLSQYSQEGLTDKLMLLILEKCRNDGKTSWSYINKTLENHLKDKIYTVEMYETKRLEYNAKKDTERKTGKQYNNKPVNSNNFEQRTYDDSFYDGLYDNVKAGE